MLTIILRRVVLTGLIVTTFAGAGLLFGHRALGPHGVDAVVMTAAGHAPAVAVELTAHPPRTGVRRRGGVDWMFFSFRKGAR